jgi:hypothetical protein
VSLPSSSRTPDWNVHATNAILSARQSPQVTTLTYATVQGAVYDAVNAIEGSHRPYLAAPPANPWDSQDAAAATAALRVLVALSPAQQSSLEARYQESLAAIPDGPIKDGGIAAARERPRRCWLRANTMAAVGRSPSSSARSRESGGRRHPHSSSTPRHGSRTPRTSTGAVLGKKVAHLQKHHFQPLD